MHRAVQGPPNFSQSPTLTSVNWASWLSISYDSWAQGQSSSHLCLKELCVSCRLWVSWDQAPYCTDIEGQAQPTLFSAGGLAAAVGLLVWRNLGYHGEN